MPSLGRAVASQAIARCTCDGEALEPVIACISEHYDREDVAELSIATHMTRESRSRRQRSFTARAAHWRPPRTNCEWPASRMEE